MKLTWPLFFISAIILMFGLAGCQSSDNTENAAADETNAADAENTQENEVNEEENENNAEQPENDNEQNNDENNSEAAVEATAPSENEETVSFTRITWMLGSPDRKPEAGIWFYTEDDHPSSKEDTFDYENNDVLLYQISDEEYRGHELRAQKIILEDDVARIIVKVHDEPEEDEEDLEMPRQYLNVEKDVLRGKSFIVETEDGETLSLQ